MAQGSSDWFDDNAPASEQDWFAQNAPSTSVATEEAPKAVPTLTNALFPSAPSGYVGRGEFAADANKAPIVSPEESAKSLRDLNAPFISPEIGAGIARGQTAILSGGMSEAVPYLTDKLFGKNLVSGAVRGAVGAEGDLISSLSTPTNLALVAAGGPLARLGKLGTVLLSSAFEAQALKQAPEQWNQFKDALATGDYEKATRTGLDMVAGIGLPTAAVAIHGMAPKASLTDTLFPKPEKPPELPLPGTYKKETGTVTYDYKQPERTIPSASEITSPTGIPSEQVRPSVDEKTPLRQPRETPETRQVEQTPQEVAAEKPTTAILADTNKYPVQELPVSELKLSKDVPNFKETASKETGVVPGQELAGKYNRLSTGAITVWERADGTKEVISGRHRLDLAKRTGEETIPSQVVREADGFTKADAITFDAEANIRDGQGSTSDYANYFRNSKITPEEASSRGLLARDKGRKGFAIGQYASDDLYSLYRAGKVGESKAAAIADAGRDNPDLQNIGIRAANSGASIEEVKGQMEAAQNAAGAKPESASQSDFFGDTSLGETWKAQGKYVAEQRKALRDIISTRKSVVNKYEAATSTGSIKATVEKATAELTDAQAKLARWQEWGKHPDLRAEVESLGKLERESIDSGGVAPGDRIEWGPLGTSSTGRVLKPMTDYVIVERSDGQVVNVHRDSITAHKKPIQAAAAPKVEPPIAKEVPEPKLLPGEKQGDLISSTQAEPFALAGEKVTEAPPEAPAAPSLAEQGQNDLFKGFGEETPQSQKLGLLPQPSQFVKTDVAKAVQGAIKGAEQVKAAFAPPNVSKVAGVTARVIRENAAELARKKEMATVGLKDAASALRRNSPAENLDIINRLETGQPLPNTAMNQYKAARTAAYDERIAQVRAVNPNALQDLIENYFPHLWTKESIAKVQGNLANLPPDNAWARVFGKRPLAGPASFLKERTIPTTADGIAIGLEPVTTNPVALDLLKMHEMDRYVMGQKVMGELKDQGIAKFVPAGSKPDFGYTKIDDRIARVLAPRDWKIVDAEGNVMPGQKVLGDYYAPDDAARVINNYLSPGLKGNAIYDGFRFVGNLMNQVQLGISLYHATFTSIDAATSTLALGLEQVARSGGSPAELATAAGNIAKAFVEAPVGGAMIENLWRGNKFLREYSKPGTTNAELAKIVDAAVAGGARTKMGEIYNTGAIGSFFDALKSGNYAGAALRAPFAVVQAAAKPLMEYAVPRMKLGIISQNLEYELSKLPKNATRDDVRAIAARVVDSVDNRMGQLIYDNLFWNKALKDGLMASVRSVGWNLGDIRELGGGILDTVTAPKRAYRELTKGSQIADNPIVTKRMAYMVALPVMVGALGSMYQYLMTGEGPKDLMDVYMPRTGKLKADGTAERVMLPTYMKDIAPLALAATREGAVGLVKRSYSMGLNKLHPAITTIGQMLHNQDYYGNQIRNQDDGLVQTIQKEAEFIGKNFRPFSVQGVIQREGGVKEKTQAVIGLMPAPRELTDTPAMRMIHDINLSKRPAGGYTEAQQQKRVDKKAASQGQDLRPELFKRLSKEEKAKVLEVATPEERSIFQRKGSLYKHK